MPEFLTLVSPYIAPCTLVIDAVLVLVLLLLCIVKHFHPLIVLKRLLPDARPLLTLFFVIILVFVNLYALAHYLGSSGIHYGEFCHFFNVGNQHVELAAGAAEGAEGPTAGQQWAFFIACVTAIAGNFLLSGAFVSVLVGVFATMASRIRNGLVSPRVLPGSVAILGYRQGMAEALLRKLLQYPAKYRNIVLLTEQEVPKLRLALSAALPDGVWKQLRLVHGGWAEQEDLRQLKLWRCQDIYLLGEEGEQNHDSLSLKALGGIQNVLSQRCRAEGAAKPLCHIFWEERDFFNIMLTSDIAMFISGRQQERHYDVRTYHLQEMLATNVLIAEGWDGTDDTKCPPLDRICFLQHPEKRVHFIIMGMSPFGRALLRATILQAHYPHYAQDKSRRTLITIIDPQAEAEMEKLRNLHPLFFERVRYEHCDLEPQGRGQRRFNESRDLLDTELHFLSARLESEHVQRFLATSAEQPHDVVTVAVCLEDSTLALKTAMNLSPELRRHGIPVYVQQESRENLLQHNLNVRARLLRQEGSNGGYLRKLNQASAAYANLYPVGCMESLFDLHRTDFSLPKLFHRIYTCTKEQIDRKAAGETSGIARLEQLCDEARRHPSPMTASIAEAGSGAPGIWARFYAECIGLEGVGADAGEEMEKLPLILNWSNRYLAEVQTPRRRQFPAPQGEGDAAQWGSVLQWMNAFNEMEHQRWMAERLLNEDPVSKPNAYHVPLEDLPEDVQHYDAFLCLATYLAAELGE